MANKIKVDTSDISALLQTVLGTVKGLAQEALDAVKLKYAPRIAALSTSADPTAELADITENMEVELLDLGIEAESLPGTAIMTAIAALANFAVKALVLVG